MGGCAAEWGGTNIVREGGGGAQGGLVLVTSQLCSTLGRRGKYKVEMEILVGGGGAS